MKLVCNQSDLNTHLSLVARAVPSRPTHPVLANVLLKADEKTQQVSLTGFDLSLGIQTSFDAEILESGEFTLPAKLLGDIVAKLPQGNLTLEVAQEDDQDGEIATLTASSGRYEIRGIGAREFPELPMVEDGKTLSLSIESLGDGLKGSLFATSPDETKQVLTGVHFTLLTDCLEFAATDGHRLAVVRTDSPEDTLGEAEPIELTIPARALRELEKLLFLLQGSKSATESIELYFDTTQIVFHGGEHRLTTRTLEGMYPSYRKLIPQQFQRTVTVDRKLLMTSVERIAVLADQKNNIVKFNLDSENQLLSLAVEAADVGSGCESISAQISGEDLEIGFNVKYLLEGLKVLQSSEVQIQLNTNLSPVIITPLGGEQITYLIMPVQIRK